MINLNSGVRRFDTVFVVALLTLIALTASLLVLVSAKQYNITADKMNTNYESRTISSFLREKTRQSDENGQIAVGTFCESISISMTQTLDTGNYVTYIYEHDGYLYEAFVKEGASASLSSGQKILPVKDFHPALDELGNLVVSYSTSDELSHQVIIDLKTTKGPNADD